ncbi:putative small acidic protein [Rosa chinensis]|uniref:Putative small acidic protein n=1 Tax=Rosa chinensis TaxID=74649 RepID=A0A2P6PS68_ROSCH|nr:DNA topoisomerase 1 isoform X2 [Rosa chinensis]PRQ24773.1 putative small acidic protein [Rosa chinensis]
MDSNLDSPFTDRGTAFSKPSKDKVKRNYRRRSPVSGSSSSDGSPEHNNSSSPKLAMGDPGKVSEHQPRRIDDWRELNRDSERSYCGRSSDSYRHSDRQSRNSKGYYGQADYIKNDKHADDEERTNQKLFSRSDRESRGSAHFDNVRSREYSRHFDKNSRDTYDGSEHRSKDKERGSKFLEYQKYKDDSLSERVGSGRSHGHVEDMERERDRHKVDRDSQDEKRDHRRSSGYFRSERNLSYEESRGHCSGSISRRDDSKHRESEGYKSDLKEMDDEKLARDQRKKYDDVETKRSKDRVIKEPTERSENEDKFRIEDQESAAKRAKFFNLEKGIAGQKDVSKFTTTSDGRESSSSKQVQDGKMENDINAAKVAAMKAAELVNRNLAGAGPVGCMTADQKKKLLWGNKKNTTAEEAGHRWDTALFPDRERQEKFKKLMGVKGELKVEHNPDNQEDTNLLRAEKQKELQQDLEKQYTAGLRRRDGRTVGLGL